MPALPIAVRERACEIIVARQSLADLIAAQVAEAPTFLDWMRENVGPNWVLARRSARLEAKYGKDCAFVSQSRYAAEQAAYQEATGLGAHWPEALA